MNMIRTILLFAIAALFISTPALAHATRPTPVAFTVASGSVTVIESRTVDGTVFETANQSLTFTGAFQGMSIQTFSLIISSTGQYVIHGKGVFTGTVEGSESGTANYLSAGTGTFSPYSQQGHLTFGQGTGGLVGLHAQGAYQSSSPTVTPLSIPIHFDPA